VQGEVLLIGATGLLGSDVHAEMQSRDWVVDAPSHAMLDLEDPRSIDAYFLSARHAWVVNCAAYTAVDDAETHEDRARVLNAVAPFSLARFCRWVGSRLLHISTDFVFDGESVRPYREEDPPNPLGVYANSKLHGEQLAQEENKEMVIVRTAWLFGAHGKCFPKTILRAALEGKPLSVVSDQRGSPSYTKDIAAALCKMMEMDAPPGTYHVANSGDASWHELAAECLSRAGILAGVAAIKTEDWPTAARRPKYSVLDCSKYVSLVHDPLPHWKDGVTRFVEEALPGLQTETVGKERG
jgi:dTDP-4-dehydrorhamnose reductase